MTACERGGLSWSSMPYLLYSLLHLFLVTGTTCFPPSVTCIFLRHSGAKYMVPRSLPVLKPLFPRLTEWPLHLGPPHQSHGPWPGCYRPLCHVIRSPLFACPVARSGYFLPPQLGGNQKRAPACLRWVSSAHMGAFDVLLQGWATRWIYGVLPSVRSSTSNVNGLDADDSHVSHPIHSLVLWIWGVNLQLLPPGKPIISNWSTWVYIPQAGR